MKRKIAERDGSEFLFREIRDSIPDEVTAFFERFESSRNQLTLTQEVDVLNAVAREEYLRCAGDPAKSGGRSPALMRWYEVHREDKREDKDSGEIDLIGVSNAASLLLGMDNPVEDDDSLNKMKECIKKHLSQSVRKN